MDSPLKAALDGTLTIKDLFNAINNLTVAITVAGDAYWYITAREYRRQTGISESTWFNLKKLGKLEKGIHASTKGRSHILIHRCFNINSQEIRISELDLKRAKQTVDRRKNNGRKKTNIRNSAATGSGETKTQRCAGNETEQHLPRSKELQTA
jgi:hypothetical protein